MLKKILLAVVAAIATFCVVATLQPDDFRITRTAVLAAPASAIFPHVNNLHNWDAWSPWAKLDPNATNSFEGPAEGFGAVMRWAGNSQVGKGSMTIIESRPNELVKFTLAFLEPFEATNTAEFSFKEENGKTTVTWSMYGKKDFIGKAMGLIIDCDKMVGGEFEKGLGNLRFVVEGK